MSKGLPYTLTIIALPALVFDGIGCVVDLKAVITNDTVHRWSLLGISVILAFAIVSFFALMPLLARRQGFGPVRVALGAAAMFMAYAPVAIMFYTLRPS